MSGRAAVVGAGITGLVAGRELARAGWSVEIYPEDRGTNYGVRLGREVAATIGPATAALRSRTRSVFGVSS